MKKNDLIEEIERYGKVILEWSVYEDIVSDDEEEPMFEKVWAGDCIQYKYKSTYYEITTWNEHSHKHYEGEKTLKKIDSN